MTTSRDVLACPMQQNDAEAATIGKYLERLLSGVWVEDEGFDGKRSFGNSDWKFEVYIALSKAGLIDGLGLDENDYVSVFPQETRDQADDLVLQAIESLVP